MTSVKMVQIVRLLEETCCFHFQSRKVSHAAKFRAKYTEKEKWPGPESERMGGKVHPCTGIEALYMPYDP